jgi:hypothetical protein
MNDCGLKIYYGVTFENSVDVPARWLGGNFDTTNRLPVYDRLKPLVARLYLVVSYLT